MSTTRRDAFPRRPGRMEARGSGKTRIFQGDRHHLSRQTPGTYDYEWHRTAPPIHHQPMAASASGERRREASRRARCCWSRTRPGGISQGHPARCAIRSFVPISRISDGERATSLTSSRVCSPAAAAASGEEVVRRIAGLLDRACAEGVLVIQHDAVPAKAPRAHRWLHHRWWRRAPTRDGGEKRRVPRHGSASAFWRCRHRSAGHTAAERDVSIRLRHAVALDYVSRWWPTLTPRTTRRCFAQTSSSPTTPLSRLPVDLVDAPSRCVFCGVAMTVQTVLDPSTILSNRLRVLPGGSFGNMPAELSSRKERAAASGRGGPRDIDFLLGPGRCSWAMPIPT